jgi:branched-chain amino acid transport system substrate-binding protein
VKWIIVSLTVLAIMGWGLSFSLITQNNMLKTQLHVLELERGKLQESVSELRERIFENVTLQIGVTAANDYDYNRTKRFFEEIVEKDINEYCSKLEHNVKFKFIVKNNEGTAAAAIRNLQEFKEMGIDIVIGHPWSSQCSASMIYVDKNNMLLFSSSSQSSQLARPGDNLLRLHPCDASQGRIIAEMLISRGIKAAIIIQGGDAWADGIYSVLEDEFSERGGIILQRIRYSFGCVDFRGHLAGMEAAADETLERYGRGHVAVVIISYPEGGTKIVKQARDYPLLYSLSWFGSDSIAGIQAFIDEAPEESAHLKLLSPLPAPTRSTLYYSLNQRYNELFSEHLDFDMASKYDIAWIIVKAILEAKTLDVKRLLKVIPDVASMTFGASGWCKLDENGDRETADYEIYGYGYIDGVVTNIKYGIYDSGMKKIFWFNLPG